MTLLTIRRPFPRRRPVSNPRISDRRRIVLPLPLDKTGTYKIPQVFSTDVLRLHPHPVLEHFYVRRVTIDIFRKRLDVHRQVDVEVLALGKLEPDEPHGAFDVRLAFRGHLLEAFRVDVRQDYVLIAFERALERKGGKRVQLL